MNTRHLVVILLFCCLLVSCHDNPVTPPPPPPPTIAEQIAAWDPRIIVEEPVGGSNPSLEINTTTPGDTICEGRARFRIDSANVPDSVVWTLGAGTYTTLRFSVTKIPKGAHTVQALLRKRFRSDRENKDTVVERFLEHLFVSLDGSYSLTIGKWVPVDPTETRIDTLRVLYQEIIPGIQDLSRPGIQDTNRRNYVLGVTRGCDTAEWNSRSMYMSLRRYAVNFERDAIGGNCQWAIGELVCRGAAEGVYRFQSVGSGGVQSIEVRRPR